MFRDSTIGTQNPKILYFALGSGTSSPSSANTKLDNEVFRKKITAFSTSTAGIAVLNVYLAALDAVGLTINEIGVFGGSATATPNSGVMVGRGLWTPTHNPKINTDSAQLQLTMTF